MISISKSAAEVLIRRLSSIQLSLAALETEVTDLKTIYNKQCKPLEAEKECRSSETEVADLKTTCTRANPLDELIKTEEGSLKNDVKALITISDDEAEEQEESLQIKVEDLTSYNIDEKEKECVKIEVVDLTSIIDDEIEKRGESSQSESHLQSKFPFSSSANKPSISRGHSDYSQQELKRNVGIIDKAKIRAKIEEIDNTSFTNNEDGYISIFTDCSYLDNGRAGRNLFKFSVKYSKSKNEMIDLTSVSENIVENQVKNSSLETEVVNLTTIYESSKFLYPLVEKTGISSQIQSSLQSRFPYSFPENNSPSWGHSDYLQQEKNKDIIDKLKIQEKDRACSSTNKDEQLYVYTDGSYLGGARAGNNLLKFPVNLPSSNTKVVDLTSVPNPVVRKPYKSLNTEVVDLTSISNPVLQKLDKSTNTEVVDLTSILNPVVGKPNKSSETDVVDLTFISYPLPEELIKSPGKVDIIDKSKIRKIEDINHKSFTTDENGYVSVYTDGSYLEDGRAGIGVWFGPNNPLNLAEPVNKSTKGSSFKAEVAACIQAIKQANANNIKKLCINTDCLSIVDLMTKKLDKWKKEYWKNTHFELYSVSALLEDIKWRHVKGHSGIAGNEEADKLAKSASKGNIGQKVTNISAKTVAKGKIGNKAANKIANTVAQGKIGKKAAKKIAKKLAKTKTGNESSATKIAIQTAIQDMIQLEEEEGAIQYNCVCCQESGKTGSGIVGKDGAVNLAMQGANMSNESFFTVESGGFVQVYIHGIHEKDGEKDLIGVGVWFGHEHPLNMAEPVNKQFCGGLVLNPCAYNGAEVVACIRAIEQAHKSGIKKLSIYSYTNDTINSIKKILHTASSNTKIRVELIRLNEVMNLLKFLKWSKTTNLIRSEEACILARRGALMLKVKPEELHPTKKRKIETSPNDEEVVMKRKKRKFYEMQWGSFNLDPLGNINVFIATSCIIDGDEINYRGIGVWFGHGHPLNLSEPVKSNIKIVPNGYNGAEIVACTRAIEEAHINGLRKLHIKTRHQHIVDYARIFSRAKEVPKFADRQPELCDFHKALQLLEIRLHFVSNWSGLELREGFEAAESLARQGASWAEI